MKELLIIVGVTALGAGVGLCLRESPSVASPTPMQITTAADLERPARPATNAARRYGHVEETTLADGRREVTHYNSNGSKGIRITYGTEQAPTMPTGTAPPYRAPNMSSGGGGARPAARC